MKTSIVARSMFEGIEECVEHEDIKEQEEEQQQQQLREIMAVGTQEDWNVQIVVCRSWCCRVV